MHWQRFGISLTNLRCGTQQWLSSSRSRWYSVEDKKKEIEQMVKNNKLVVFMKGSPDSPKCGFSRAVCQILERHGLTSYKYINVLEDEEMRQGVKSVSNWPTIPQVFLDGEFIGGRDILFELHQSGELSQMLSRAQMNKKSQ